MAPTISTCWKFFTKNNALEVQCNLCGRIEKFYNSTTNLNRHLKKKHEKIFEEAKKLEKTDGNRANVEFIEVIETDPNDIPYEYSDHEISLSPPGSNSPIQTSSRKRQQGSLVLENFPSISSPLSDISSSEVPLRTSIPSNTSTMDRLLSKSVKKQKTLQQYFATFESCKPGGEKYKAITDGILYMIVKDNLPFSSVENEGFQKLCKILSPNYKIPNGGSMTDNMDKKYELLKPIKCNKLKMIENISLTCDFWTEPENCPSLFGITAHYIEDGQLKMTLLDVKYVPEDHTAKNISDYLTSTLQDWNIPIEKISGVVTDNAANIVKACLNCFEPDLHFGCFAHTLNVIIMNTLKTLKNKDSDSKNGIQLIINQVKTIVEWLNQSNIAIEELKELTDLHLIQSCVTRWKTYYLMIQRFFNLTEEISEILLQHTDAPPMLTASSIQILKDIEPILAIFFNATKETSEEKWVSISKLIPICDFMITQLNNIDICTFTSEGQEFFQKIIEEFDSKLKNLEVNYLCGVSTILDPRYKKLFFQNASNCSKAVDRVQRLIKMNVASSFTLPPSDSSASKLNTSSSSFENFTQSKARESGVLISKDPSELSLYLKAPVINTRDDPLLFWEKNKNIYPQLYQLSKKFLCIRGVSTPLDRLSSIAEYITNARRNRVTADRLARILFLKYLSEEDWCWN